MYKAGVNITELRSNKDSHPERESHYYTAIKIIEKLLKSKTWNLKERNL